jgi:hypothetical protein
MNQKVIAVALTLMGAGLSLAIVAVHRSEPTPAVEKLTVTEPKIAGVNDSPEPVQSQAKAEATEPDFHWGELESDDYR